ncbi:hypothetical protein [Geodermatophilus sabuli]|uniref:Uncharacterized protein n=1 Tax=Geodermatophilus sabuli TaxID=1564158 RepID=A0A285EMP7_9ACTN|nr:hypothetical protein [Geodermatophilus sabuli]MBB3086959.1 hypothetical protein [Geodermatophilus sabuli]SNX99261.1 hypothetical protein SAMN06893097_11653 [Geodermatophilus sabuli]
MALLPLVVLLVLAGTVAVGAAVSWRSPPSREATVAAARTHGACGAVAAVLLGAAAALYVGQAGLGNSSPGGLGVTALLVPVAFGVVHTGVLTVAELTWPRPRGQVRRARLVRRGVLDAAPRWLVRLAAAAALAATVLLASGAALADGSGRRFSYAYGDTAGATATASPFPGAFYGQPAAWGLLLLALTTAAALWIVATRPAVATDDERAERALRRASAHRVLRGAVAASLVTVGGLTAVGGQAVWSAASHQGAGPVAVTGAVAAFLGLASLLAGVVVACVRAPGIPADQPVSA